jgi:glycosyltransferase involved in cell wall biosynthesis
MDSRKIIPVAVIIPTINRAPILIRTLKSLFDQDQLPQSVIIVDASNSDESRNGIQSLAKPAGIDIQYAKAIVKGAAHQRSQALSMTSLPFVCFMDDDILLEPYCIQRVFDGFSQDDNIGGVVAMITNQRYFKPGSFTKFMYRLFDGNRSTWAGRVIGPAWNILPEDDPLLPEYVKCDWMNLGCTIYRTAALPNPVFPEHYKGYSMFEDLTLSLTVGRNWTLLNARTARIFHDSQPGDHKSRIVQLSEMEVLHRHYIMKEVLRRNGFKDYMKLIAFELFQASALFRNRSSLRLLPGIMVGKFKGYLKVLFS